ncbi:hypothetical protein THRCLA_00809 [Thraustotheca clavata]|uniref:Uncharacterized protein n=1 Tax=Thraustotheca clavata TaxID=74557 RepID=A0A1W0AA85_9STRA|nr:hypothetical protein THRCLA_00809 [Thraustotheca clavata]
MTENAPNLSLSHYATPYLTCGQCNSLNFIDVTLIKGIRKNTNSSCEGLPPCIGCGHTVFYQPSVWSLSMEIEMKAKQEDNHEKKRTPAAIQIQRIARGYLGRMEAKRRLKAKIALERKIFNAAASIQRIIRGVEARTKYRIEQCIFVIFNAHKLVYTYATINQPNLPRIFWYDNAEELAVFREDYREFVRRTGNRPPLWRVEANVIEITKRVLRRENQLVARIQATWRGITTRSAYLELKRQLGWNRSCRHAPAVQIQRVARMHADRKKCWRAQPNHGRENYVNDYLLAHQQKQQSALQRHLDKTLLTTYRKHVQHKRGAKILGQPIQVFRISKQHENLGNFATVARTLEPSAKVNAFLQTKAKLDRTNSRKRDSFPKRLRDQVTYDSSERERDS